MSLTVATCQFPTSADVARNAEHIARLLREAHERGAHVAHFPEACLSGYAGADLATCDSIDWSQLRSHTEELFALAGSLGLWMVLGSTHPLTAPHKPHNSLYVVDATGTLVDRYDKRFCAGDATGTTGDLAHYSSGDHASVFDIEGLRCGALICHDYRYPELAREYVRAGVQVLFHSFHAAHVPADRLAEMRTAIGAEHHARNHGSTYPEITMRASMIAVAASSHMAVSCPNSSARESCWGSFFVRADGVVTGELERHATDVLLSTVDPDEELYDSTGPWRARVLAGTLHSGKLVEDARSRARREL